MAAPMPGGPQLALTGLPPEDLDVATSKWFLDEFRLQSQHSFDRSCLLQIAKARLWLERHHPTNQPHHANINEIKEPTVRLRRLIDSATLASTPHGDLEREEEMPWLDYLACYASPYVLVEAIKAWSPWFLSSWVTPESYKTRFSHWLRTSQRQGDGNQPHQDVWLEDAYASQVASKSGYLDTYTPPQNDASHVRQDRPQLAIHNDCLLGWRVQSLEDHGFARKAMIDGGLFHVLAFATAIDHERDVQVLSQRMPASALAWLPPEWPSLLTAWRREGAGGAHEIHDGQRLGHLTAWARQEEPNFFVRAMGLKRLRPPPEITCVDIEPAFTDSAAPAPIASSGSS